MAGLSGDRKRLAEQMDESRAEQRMSWEQVARRGGISIALLRRIRSGGRITKDSEIAIERGLDWVRGSVTSVLRGGTCAYGFVEPTPTRNAPSLDPRTASPEELGELLEQLRDNLVEDLGKEAGLDKFATQYTQLMKIRAHGRRNREAGTSQDRIQSHVPTPNE